MDKNTSLYRFTSFEALIDIIQRESLIFVSPKKWEDAYEGFLYSMAKTEVGQRLISAELSKYLKPEQIEGTLGLLSFIDITYFAQCWTKKAESDALWKIYSHNNTAIRLEVKADKFQKLKYSSAIIIGEVNYFQDISIGQEVKSIISGEKILGHKALLSKRLAFEHEEEVRIIASNFDNVNKFGKSVSSEELESIKKMLDDAVKQGFMPQVVADEILKEKGPLDTKILIPIGKASDFIESIMLHPAAPDWFDATLAEYCNRANIKYLGKSKLYKLNLHD